MSAIKTIKAREILDSKGTPTVETDLTTDLGTFSASVPSGVSTGKNEAVELRDGGKRYFGKGVLKAVAIINEAIAPRLVGESAADQGKIDWILRELDGTENKSKLGANSILAISLAVCRAGAAEKGLLLYQYLADLAGRTASLPQPCFLMIEGGKHAGNKLAFQEFMVCPEAESFQERLRKGAEIYEVLRLILEKEKGKLATNVGLEGGFSVPCLKTTEEALDLIKRAIKKAGYQKETKIILDAAATTFFKNKRYQLEGKKLSREKLLEFYGRLIRKYPLAGVEDAFSEEDNEGFQLMTQKFGKKLLVIGDDFLTTNVKRIQNAQAISAGNALILKPNQVGTVSETISAAKEALKNNWQVFVKHRSGETNDDFIADLAVGLGTGWIMAGAPCRGERVAKYNRLLRIEGEMDNSKISLCKYRSKMQNDK